MIGDNYRKVFEPGEVIFREGEPGDSAYIIEDGRVEVTGLISGQPMRIAEVGVGEILGEMALVDDQLRAGTATAVDRCEVVVVPREYINEKMQHADPLLNLLIKVILARFRDVHFRLIEAAGGIFQSRAKFRRDVRKMRYQAETQTTSKRLKLEHKLRSALDKGELELHYQPIVALNEGSWLAGCEALIRWRHPELGLIPPIEFIGLAEETGLIKPIGEWLIREACGAAKRFNSCNGGKDQPVLMSINLSSRQFEDRDLPKRVDKAIRDAKLSPSLIKLEITESLLMSNPEASGMLLGELKQLGVSIALDDFGTGYSSFSYLHRFPIDTLKIDCSFIRTMLDNDKSLAIVRSLIDLAIGLDINVIAEGIEREEEVILLQGFSCQMGQGYLYSRPVPEADFMRLLENGMGAVA